MFRFFVLLEKVMPFGAIGGRVIGGGGVGVWGLMVLLLDFLKPETTDPRPGPRLASDSPPGI